jgi:hypothetical protein
MDSKDLLCLQCDELGHAVLKQKKQLEELGSELIKVKAELLQAKQCLTYVTQHYAGGKAILPVSELEETGLHHVAIDITGAGTEIKVLVSRRFPRGT